MIGGCVGHHDPSDFDLIALGKASVELSKIEDGFIPKEKWPGAVLALKPEGILKDGTGIYIKLNSFMAEESGVFFPVGVVKEGAGNDPSYKLIGSNIYSYYIKG